MRHWANVLFLSILCLATAIGCADDPIGAPDAPGTVDIVKDASSEGTVPGRDGTTAADSARDANVARDASSDTTASCPTGQAACASACVDLQSSTTNCGACGTTCASGEVCSRGVCASTCGTGTTKCGEVCKDLQSDPTNCGACGTSCTIGQVCSAGTCALMCSPGLVTCGGGDAGAGTCVNTSNDRFNCGVCGTTCSAGNVCGNGACAVSCPGNQINCGGTCVDPNTSRLNCGATAGCGVGDAGSAGAACTAGNVCSGGTCAVSCPGSQVNCNGICVDPTTDRGYCGAVGNCQGANDGTACAPGQVCSGSVCQLSCAVSQVKCGGSCVDPLSNNTYCGATGDCAGPNDGNVCPSGQICSGGLCQVSCGSFQINCNGSCVDPRTDRAYCGASGDCQGPNDGAICVPGEVCASGACSTLCPVGQVNCSGLCIDPATDPFHCNATNGCGVTGGSAGTSCDATNRVCIASACDVACASPNIKCGSTCIDPNSNPGHCGATAGCGASGASSAGAVCTSGQACAGGSCLDLVMKVVFVSSTMVNSNFGGLAAGDALCQGRAVAASLPGIFKAWLSTSGVGNSAGERLTHYAGSYVLPDRTTVVANGWSDLTDSTLDHAIDQTESGGVAPDGTLAALCSPGSVYTGTNADGTFSAGGDCAGWTATVATGVAGVSSYSNLYWTNGCSGGICGRTAPLYCIEQ